MSQGSPASDNKMDISESTSQESPCFSPTTENIESIQTTNTNFSHTKLDNNCDNNIINDNNLKQQNLMMNDEDMNSLSMRPTLILVERHPLMSPSELSPDPDSGGGGGGGGDVNLQYNIFNYPDIVPKLETNQQHTHNNMKPDIDIIVNDFNSINLLKQNDGGGGGHTSERRLSTESESELSQFQAMAAPELQTVALYSTSATKCKTNVSTTTQTWRKNSLSADLLSDCDVSSIDTLSNQSLDLASLSPTNLLCDDLPIDRNTEVFSELSVGTVEAEPLPLYTADEERRDSRHWQKITLPDGNTREIDMRVIDPYKRVLSHGGYLKSGGHNAIVVFSACHLPDRSRTDYHYVMDNLFLYVVKTLEQLVTEDYVLVYLHGGSNRGNVPPFPWLKKCYQLIDRRLRKSLKHLFIVHPTFWSKSIVWMSRPFISSKFWRKMIYVRSLDELYKLVPVEKAAIPDKVKNYDSKYS